MPDYGNSQGKPRLLIAPLDWGLGHAARCVPIISAFLRHGAEVLLAAEGPVRALLEQEFPDLMFISLQGYRVRYSRTKRGLPFQMLLQTPRLLRAINREKRWLRTIITEYKIDGVISDNRYGLSGDVPSVFITHQLLIKAASSLAERLIRNINYRYINRFTECWVPDEAGPVNWSGDLAHPSRLPRIPVIYIGIQSRLAPSSSKALPNHLLILLSGPEPQRSIFEDVLIDQLSHYNHTATFIRGLPDANRLIPSTNSLRFHNHLPAQLISEEMAKADIIITRSGYSTVMDLATVNRKAVMVPTPGQTEQEYLAQYLMKTNRAFAADQKHFNLTGVIEKARLFFAQSFNSGDGSPKNNALDTAVINFLKRLEKDRG